MHLYDVFTDTVFGGEKPQWLMGFYGYGQSAGTFENLYEQIKETHNLMVVDNPMGKPSEIIKPEDLKLYLSKRFSELEIKTFDSISYSMGSRMNLYLPIFFSNRLNKIILLAPDGISYNFWNRAAIKNLWGRALFRYFVRHKSAYMKTLHFLYKIGVVNKSMYAFSKWNMRDARQRALVYNAWMNLRFFRPKLNTVKAAIENNHIELVSFFGKNDPVIPLSIQKKCANTFPNGNHHIIDTDHNLMTQEMFTLLAKEWIT
jgi:pimeloyl-ACP methyl ester carboxylesterase